MTQKFACCACFALLWLLSASDPIFAQGEKRGRAIRAERAMQFAPRVNLLEQRFRPVRTTFVTVDGSGEYFRLNIDAWDRIRSRYASMNRHQIGHMTVSIGYIRTVRYGSQFSRRGLWVSPFSNSRVRGQIGFQVRW